VDFKALAYEGASMMLGLVIASGEPIERVRAEVNELLDKLGELGDAEQLHAIGGRLTPKIAELIDDVSALARVATGLVIQPTAPPAPPVRLVVTPPAPAPVVASDQTPPPASPAAAEIPKTCGACGAVINPPPGLGYCRACGAPLKEDA